MRDNFDFYDQHEREEAKREANVPVCDICGEKMYDWIHVSCGLVDVRVCEHCVEWEHYEEGYDE